MSVVPGAEPFHRAGTRTGFLLCHGFTGNPVSMRPWAEHLADRGLTVRVPLLPGHGRTWQEMNRTTWQEWYAEAESAFTLLRESCDTVFVGGLSMGGALVTRLAERHGPAVAGVVLVNPAIKVEDPRMRALPLLQRFVPSLAGIGDDIKKPGQSEQAYDRIPLKALHSQTRLWAEVIRDLPSVTQPVLLFRSAVDHVVPASSSALLLSRISSTDVSEVVLHDSFHVATLDHDAPRIFAETDAFVERLVGADAL
ncbi:Thermostable monoacylglycerol lipase [Nostocoides japonicum T1-X7]|uniref:Thermostable monoacylglycerol lipase n=1 Tax=Nostocoides japonicum T1-X7 TaxID=1194083 RepID=A0A077LZM9_9MICO|nr:alpha/beta fold hydrolase [Tetrasphaera japonica]CCH77425.1 Thermostable monoacylglycerol lipase [Tetrasphaera japonica T1-X7]